MIKTLCNFFALLTFIQLGYSQIVVGSYTGITQLSNITSTCAPIVNTVLGDVNFATNSAVEIPLGIAFTGTWANGLAYSDAPGPEILCVSVHTEEWWDVQLLLSDMSLTPAISAQMITIEDNITLDFWDCSATLYTNFFYDRRVVALDFSSFVIPAGLTVIGARFILTVDNAGDPDPIGMLLLQGSTGPTASNNGPLCFGDTLKLFGSNVDTSTYSWSGPALFTSAIQNPIIPNVTLANAGIYTCYVTDLISSIVDTVYTTVIINPNPTATFVLPIACEQTLGSYSITGASDTITNYFWNFGTAALNDTSILTAPTFNYSTGGPYIITLEITSDEGCTSIIDTNIFIHEKPFATLTNTFACIGTSQQFDPTVISDTTVNYAWTFPTGSPTTSIDSVPTINFPVGGNTNINLILTTDFGCKDTFDFPFNVATGFSPNFGVYPICISRFTFDPLPGIGDSTWVIDWSMGDGTLYNNVDTSTFNYNYQLPGTYNVQMIVINSAGCIDSVTIPVVVNDSLLLIMPNILYESSTLGNNKIDFEIVLPGFNSCITYTYTIFDRWGLKVFETTNDPLNPDLFCSFCFKGETQNGNLLNSGTYYYIMQGNFNILKTGFITIFE